MPEVYVVRTVNATCRLTCLEAGSNGGVQL